MFTDRISEITASKENFDNTIYTSLADALKLLEKRQNNTELNKLSEPYLRAGIPELLSDGPRVTIFRQLVTPNYEIRRFMCVPDATNLPPLFFEYYEDKFTSNNPLKYYLGKMAFHHGIGKKGGHKISYKTIIDFNKSNGKKIQEVKTHKDESLIDFHHGLMEKAYKNSKEHFFDASEWFHRSGKNAKDYYKSYLALFIKNAILFENFVLEGEELTFTKEVFLPAFLEVWDKTGEKPLIVALEPTEIEGDIFWMCHPAETIVHIEE